MQVSCDKMMHILLRFWCIKRMNPKGDALDKHQNWIASALFCHKLEYKVNMQLLI